MNNTASNYLQIHCLRLWTQNHYKDFHKTDSLAPGHGRALSPKKNLLRIQLLIKFQIQGAAFFAVLDHIIF